MSTRSCNENNKKIFKPLIKFTNGIALSFAPLIFFIEIRILSLLKTKKCLAIYPLEMLGKNS